MENISAFMDKIMPVLCGLNYA